MRHIADILTEALSLPQFTPVCFGICCPRHADCARYAAVEGAQPEQPRMDNCGPEFGAFEPIQRARAFGAQP